MHEEKQMLDEAIALGAVAHCKRRQISDALADEVISLIKADVHQASTRPCETCRKVTAILGEPFWCLRLALRGHLDQGVRP